MQLQFVIFAVYLVTTAAFPVPQDSVSTWDTNLAINKADLTKQHDGMWKTHVVSNDLYSQDSLNPMAAELRHKLSQESERLLARLRQELVELRQRLSPYPSHPHHSPTNIRDLLAPFTRRLQEALDSNTHDLCGHLMMTLQGLHPDRPSLYQEAMQSVGQSLDEGHRRRTAAFEDFKTKAFEAVEEDRDSSRKELWEEVTARLGQEILSFSLEVQGKVAALKVSLTTLLTSSDPPRSEIITKVDQFCNLSASQNEKFISNLEQLTARLEEKQSQGEQSSHANIDSIQEDFSTRLNALLQDIVHTLN
ncbi:uncharacterized protein zgc:162608 [Trichomycterus rosablanca]|uniref:uncharacterized protein zgc:162608 n=1 Tax=Trichomycterus rosablanca TaxID=2290929 RepID=UPI002F35C8FA